MAKRNQFNEKGLKSLGNLLGVASDASRLKILCLVLRDKKTCVSQIADQAGMSVAAASHHLRVMAKRGLLEPVRDGKAVCYRLIKNQPAKDLRSFICKYIKINNK